LNDGKSFDKIGKIVANNVEKLISILGLDGWFRKLIARLVD
jgi:hypothetical protein